MPYEPEMAHRTRWQHGGLKILPHGFPKTRGEPFGARYERRCGVMTALPGATGNIPIVRDAWQIWRVYLNMKRWTAARYNSQCNCESQFNRVAVFLDTSQCFKNVFWDVVLYLKGDAVRTTNFEMSRMWISNPHLGRKAIVELWLAYTVAFLYGRWLK